MTIIDLTAQDKEAIRRAVLIVTTGHAFSRRSTKMEANTITSIFEIGDTLRDIVERLGELELLEEYEKEGSRQIGG